MQPQMVPQTVSAKATMDHMCTHRQCQHHQKPHVHPQTVSRPHGPHVHPLTVPRPPWTTYIPTDSVKATTDHMCTHKQCQTHHGPHLYPQTVSRPPQLTGFWSNYSHSGWFFTIPCSLPWRLRTPWWLTLTSTKNLRRLSSVMNLTKQTSCGLLWGEMVYRCRLGTAFG